MCPLDDPSFLSCQIEVNYLTGTNLVDKMLGSSSVIKRLVIGFEVWQNLDNCIGESGKNKASYRCIVLNLIFRKGDWI